MHLLNYLRNSHYYQLKSLSRNTKEFFYKFLVKGHDSTFIKKVADIFIQDEHMNVKMEIAIPCLRSFHLSFDHHLRIC